MVVRGKCVLFPMWYFVLVLENRKLGLYRMCGSVPGVGCECIVLLFRMDMLNCELMCIPLVLF